MAHLTIYEPILDRSGNVLGILFVGVRRDQFMQGINDIIWQSLAAGALVVLLGGGAILVVVRRTMRPLGLLGDVTRRIAAGDVAGEDLLPRGADEIGRMADAVGCCATRWCATANSSPRRSAMPPSSSRSVGKTERERMASAERQRLQAEELSQVLSVLGEALSELASGNLAHRMDQGLPAQYSGLVNDFNQTTERLSAMVGQIQAMANDVGLAAREIRLGSDNLSKRTEEQASSLQETAATTEEMTAIVRMTGISRSRPRRPPAARWPPPRMAERSPARPSTPCRASRRPPGAFRTSSA